MIEEVSVLKSEMSSKEPLPTGHSGVDHVRTRSVLPLPWLPSTVCGCLSEEGVEVEVEMQEGADVAAGVQEAVQGEADAAARAQEEAAAAAPAAAWLGIPL